MHGLKDEIMRSWHSDDRVTTLKLSIKVARLLMDTSVAQFYPTIFVLGADIMDMLGDMMTLMQIVYALKPKRKDQQRSTGIFIFDIVDFGQACENKG
ncbi:unnamed protein product [Lactuca saligna]|uniref:Uncharacterized protein n=1 Tax=Lactuca saligna TaxID=75948 RepID=A0AA35VIW9_LACSI|nr:unnamed protein product [Lactuca saligna]